VIIRSAVAEFELQRDPVLGVRKFDTSTHQTYTEESPNSLRPEHVPAFLEKMRKLCPQFYAITPLGFATGLRPSSLCPLRRCGEAPDVLWTENVLLVRRSHTERRDVMATTKTKRHQRLSLPEALIDVLRWHVETQIPARIAARSYLLFPARTGSFHSRSALDKPFRAVSAALAKSVEQGGIELGYRVTPKGCAERSRTWRAANIRDVVTRAVSGHATEAMQRHYSTVNADEVRDGIAKVIELAGFRLRNQPALGDVRGDVEPKTESPASDECASGAESLASFGAGEGIRTLDVNLGNSP
jgi:integrase